MSNSPEIVVGLFDLFLQSVLHASVFKVRTNWHQWHLVPINKIFTTTPRGGFRHYSIPRWSERKKNGRHRYPASKFWWIL